MNTPNPLVPQGSLQQHQSQGKSTIRIAVLTIIAVHAVFFTGLLLQSGCKPDADKNASNASGTKSATNNEMAKLDPGYYSTSRELPSVATNLSAAAHTQATDLGQPSSPAPASTSTSLPPPVNETPAPAKDYAIVKGDTLGKIAQQHGTTTKAVRAANGMKTDRLLVGQKIKLPAASKAGGAASSGSHPAGGSTNILTASPVGGASPRTQ